MKGNAGLRKTLCIMALLSTTFVEGCTPSTGGAVRKEAIEGQPRADLGNGHYLNPIMAGDYADPSVVRVGRDYYMTHGGSGTPSLLIWHSRDLVNWRPIGHALDRYVGDIWAPELIQYDGIFYLYIPVVRRLPDGGRRFSNFVMTARDPAGPWSEPVDLKVGHIDPGHVADPNGSRYLYLSAGHVIELTPDGLGTTGKLRKVYDGWDYPDEWVVECKCLESPKLFRRGGLYYLISAQGGTSGPSTSHMTIAARSQSPLGPWENSPYNPILRTASRDERWWSQGHGTLIEAPDGSWWCMYHAYENGFRTLGRQTLLMPIEWTPDGWPRIHTGLSSTDVLAKPPGQAVPHGMPLSDDFTAETLGPQWRFWEREEPGDTYRCGDGRLRMKAKGSSVAQAAMLTCKPANHSYEVQVEIRLSETAEAGLLLHCRDGEFGGAAIERGEAFTYWRSRRHTSVPWEGGRIFLKLRNVRHDVALFYSADGEGWTAFDKGIEVSRGFGVLRIALYAAGQGVVEFKRFRYAGLD